MSARPVLRLSRPSPRFQQPPEATPSRSESATTETSPPSLEQSIKRLTARYKATTDDANRRTLKTKLRRKRKRLRERE